MTQMIQGRFDLVPTQLAITAMRDNGYKNAAYALAELIDNAIQAGASEVEVLCSEREERVEQRIRRRVDQIAVLDNGSGMDRDTLRIALQFGNGTRLEDRSGIGRFGMGLPNASISQCRRVEVWTWQSGVEEAVYSHIDLDDVDQGRMEEVPEPTRRSVPRNWVDAAEAQPGRSGTLVVWSDLDRCVWMTARAVIDNSEFLIGRMYRQFIADGLAAIRLVAFKRNSPRNPTLEKYAGINDPLYRSTSSSTPAPFADRAMMVPYGDIWEHETIFVYREEHHKVTTRFTIASEEARQRSETGQDAGALPHGRHAARNVGISIVRAGREIDLDQALVDPSEPRDRWWGIEVEFPPALDEIFGVTNNKQSARVLSDMLNVTLEELAANEDVRPSRFLEDLEKQGDPRVGLIRLAEHIRKNLGTMRKLLRAQMRGDKRRRRYDGNAAEVRGTTATRERQEQGQEGRSDAAEERPAPEREAELVNEMEEAGLPVGQAHDLAHHIIEERLKYVFVESALDSPAFFSVTPRAGVIMIRINTEHPVYTHLLEVLEDSEDEERSATERLANAREGLKLLLEAWARYEDEQPEGPRRDEAMDARSDWGRVARRFFST